MLPLRFYWMLLVRRLPLMAGAVVFFSAVGLYAAMTLPPTFSATARLQVEAPQIPDEMINSILSTAASEQLQLIEEQLMIRTNLLDLARKYDVFENLDEMTPTAIVDAMVENTRIRRSSGRDQATLMSITFNASDARTAANVVNDYTTLVLEKNASSRRARAENTLSFFEQESERLAMDIDTQSNRIIAFKRENVDALPEDLSYRQNRQTVLQERLGRLEQERASITNQRNDMVALFEATGRLDSADVNLPPDQRRLEQLQIELREALTIYSDTNPRVQMLRNQIGQLEEIVAESSSSEDGVTTGNSIIDVTLTGLDQRVREIDQEIERVTLEIEQISQSIAATATNSITLERLERDLESIRARYNSTLNNLNQARMAERVEVKSQGQRVALIEGAVVPDEPSGPPRKKIAAAGVGVGMLAAAGIFVIFEFLNQKLRHPADMQSRFKIVPLGVIPYVETGGEKLWRRGLLVAGLLGAITLVSVGLYLLHTQVMPLEMLANRILQEMGLI